MIRWSAILCLTLGLGACTQTASNSNTDTTSRGFLAGFKGLSFSGTAPLRDASLAGGQVMVSGPSGYCIDPKTLRSSRETGFAAIASCRILSDGKKGPKVEPMLMTISVGPLVPDEILPSGEEIASYFDASLLSKHGSEKLTLAHLGARGDSVLENGDARHWRGAFFHGGHLVGLALYAPKGSRLAGDAGADYIMYVVKHIRSSSQIAPVKTAANTDIRETAPDESASNKGKRGFGSFLARVLPKRPSSEPE